MHRQLVCRAAYPYYVFGGRYIAPPQYKSFRLFVSSSSAVGSYFGYGGSAKFFLVSALGAWDFLRAAVSYDFLVIRRRPTSTNPLS